MTCDQDKPYCTFALTVLAGAWMLIALFIGETELLQVLPPITIPAIVWALVGLVLTAYWKNKALRAFVDQLDTRVLIAVHLTRFVGFYFLFLSSRGELPGSFAKSAGWGDNIVAVWALFLILKPAPGAVLAWNLFGLADILFVVFNAAKHLFRDASSMNAFTTLPLSFLPTLIVPLVIATHMLMLLRLRKAKKSAPRVLPQNALADA